MAKPKWPRFYVIVAIILLLSSIIFSLGLSTYQLREGITAQEIKDNVENESNKNIEKNKPQSTVVAKNYDVTIVDNKDYPTLELAASRALGPQGRGGGMGGGDEFYGRGGGAPVYKPVHIPRFIEKFGNQTFIVSGVSETKPNPNAPTKTLLLGETKTMTIPTETEKFYSFIVIAPDSKSEFPPEFKVSISNRQGENGMAPSLWGYSLTKREPHSNGIINPDNSGNLYPIRKAFSLDPEGGLVIAGINIGDNAINAVEMSPILNKNSVQIGAVTTAANLIEITCTIPTDKITDKATEKITGILIYLGFPDK
jgi:hypothetical protein